MRGIREAEQALTTLGASEFKHKSLVDCVAFFVANYFEPQHPITVAKAFEDFIKDKESEGCRPGTLRNLRGRVGLLVSAHREKLVSDILPTHITALLSRPGIDRTTRDNDRRAFSSFFSWCCGAKTRTDLSTAKLTRTKKRRNGAKHNVTLLSLAEVMRLLRAAGNSVSIVKNNYKNKVTKADNNSFWSITPEQASPQVLSLPTAAAK